ncbi:hypothetical protein M3O96_17805 [Aquiflexum sp. TKW24L]|uniref:C1 family peptidase n=1 Tax=Aquiflexum sp. TKW24L TaxID=2942212 RepID=UPI0020BFCB39|nr:C1 family peptidase [Aquiflexum sp. TKW24L]MCL6260964.1 hypothetical protein [Aquiflexum sp. TKW24L]
METPYTFGWQKDLPDFRDFNEETPVIVAAFDLMAKVKKPKKKVIPSQVDLREFCSPVHDQSTIGSCTAQAAVSLIEYLEIKAYGKHLDFSRLFLYKSTRNLLGWKGDRGAYLRTTIGALALFGVPPEQFYPYIISKYEDEPTAFLYSLAKNFSALNYFRLDTPGKSTSDLLTSVKESISKGLPLVFGFSVYDSINQAGSTGRIPFPLLSDRCMGGHAVLAVGYDNNIEIKHNRAGSPLTKGAILIQNSWGPNWGDNGFGWLPYEFVNRGLAVDWWSIINKSYVETAAFGF